MARPIKSNLDYFPMDVDFYSDRKIKVLLAHYGANGITLYLYLLMEIYRNGYYITIDDDFYYVASIDLRIPPEDIKEIIDYLCLHSLFDNKLFSAMNILTSKGVQLRYQEAIKARASKRKIVVEDEVWILNENETYSFIILRSEKDNESNDLSDDFECENPETDFSEINNNNSEKNSSKSLNNHTKESKVKESKINKNKEKENKVVMQVPSKDGTYCITYNDYNVFVKKYLDIDVLQSLHKMCDFLQLNPTKQRKLCAMQNYIEMWLEKDNSQSLKQQNLKPPNLKTQPPRGCSLINSLSSDTSYDITMFEKYDLFD